MRSFLALCVGVALLMIAGTVVGQQPQPTRPPQLQPTPPGFGPGMRGPGGTDYKELIPPLVEALKDPDTEVRQSAAGALAGMGSHAVQPLIDMLKEKEKDKDPELRANLAYVLGMMGGAGQDALPALAKLLKDDNREVRRRAAFAIQSIVRATEPGNWNRPGTMGGVGFPPGGFSGVGGFAPPGGATPPPHGPDPGILPAAGSDTPARTEKKEEKK